MASSIQTGIHEYDLVIPFANATAIGLTQSIMYAFCYSGFGSTPYHRAMDIKVGEIRNESASTTVRITINNYSGTGVAWMFAGTVSAKLVVQCTDGEFKPTNCEIYLIS